MRRVDAPRETPAMFIGTRLGMRSLGVPPNGYLTDGRRLLRVVSRFDPRLPSPSALLEDCATLEIRAYPPRELAEMRLQRVSNILAPMLLQQSVGTRGAESRECPTAF